LDVPHSYLPLAGREFSGRCDEAAMVNRRQLVKFANFHETLVRNAF